MCVVVLVSSLWSCCAVSDIFWDRKHESGCQQKNYYRSVLKFAYMNVSSGQTFFFYATLVTRGMGHFTL